MGSYDSLLLWVGNVLNFVWKFWAALPHTPRITDSLLPYLSYLQPSSWHSKWKTSTYKFVKSLSNPHPWPFNVRRMCLRSPSPLSISSLAIEISPPLSADLVGFGPFCRRYLSSPVHPALNRSDLRWLASCLPNHYPCSLWERALRPHPLGLSWSGRGREWTYSPGLPLGPPPFYPVPPSCLGGTKA